MFRHYGHYYLDAVEHYGDEVAYALLVVGVGFGLVAVRDDGTYGHTTVTHQAAQTGERRAFHFVVCDFAAFVFEFLNSAVEVGIGERQTQFASLRPVKAYSRDRVAAHHVIASYSVDKFFVGTNDIRLCPERIPAGVFRVTFRL